MGFSPQQVDQMSMWQYLAIAEGVSRANDPDASKELSSEEIEDIANWMGI